MTICPERPDTGSGGAFPGRLYSVSPLSNLSGAPISALNHARLFQERFGSVCLVLPVAGEILDRATELGVPVLLLPVVNRGLRSRFFRRALGQDLRAVLGSRWRYFRTLCREFRREPGIVHVHSSRSIAPLALGAARLCGMPSVLHVRDAARSWGDRWRAQSLARLASAVVCVSDGVRRGYGRGFRRRAQVIYNFMDVPPPLQSAGNNAPPQVVMAAKMSHAKGTDLFLETCRRLRDAGAAFKARMVGAWVSPQTRAVAESYIRDNRLAEVISVHGAQVDMEPVYARMDILLLPTRRDAFPRVVMEAMCHGIPVVATRVDGVPEMVEDGVTGFLVEPEDVEEFARSVERLLQDESLRRQMGRAGRERAKKLFSPEAYGEHMGELYRRLETSR